MALQKWWAAWAAHGKTPLQCCWAFSEVKTCESQVFRRRALDSILMLPVRPDSPGGRFNEGKLRHLFKATVAMSTFPKLELRLLRGDSNCQPFSRGLIFLCHKDLRRD